MKVKSIVLRARPLRMAIPKPSSIPRSVSLLTRKELCDGDDDSNYISEIESIEAQNDGVNVPPDCGGERCFADAQKAPFGDIFGGDVMEIDSLEEETCIKCNGGGEVLFCSETGCPVALHEKCAGSEPLFNDKGKFYCPYCLYKQALARTRELREKAMEAKKELSCFLDPKVVGGDRGAGKGKETNAGRPDISVLHGNKNRLDREVGEGVRADGSRELEHGPYERVVKDKQQAESSSACYTNEDTNMDGSLNTSSKQVPCRNEEQMQPQFQQNFVSPIRVRPERYAIQRTKNTGQPHNVGSPSKLAIQQKVSEGNGWGKKESPITPNDSRDRIPFSGKRKRMLWTDEEEEMIKKGVSIVSSNGNKNIPWRKILDFGRHVFHPSRQPSDLKDKWKTLSKGSK